MVLHPRLVKARADNRIDFEIPDGIVTDEWRDNQAQRVGVAHLLLVPNMVLGDGTGLGKTPQALIAWGILRKSKGWPALVLTRRANLEPWVEKVRKFLQVGTPFIYHGALRGTVQSSTPRPDHIVTTYDTAALDLDLLLDYFKGSPPVLILDEAHRLKGWNQERRRPAVERLRRDAKYVWGLTATPMGSRYNEVASILDVVCPGIWSNDPDPAQREKAFTDRYVKKVVIKLREKGKDGKKGKVKRAFYKKPKKAKDYQKLWEFFQTIEPVVLRRPVEAFGEVLPTVDFRPTFVPMSKAHRDLYEQVLDKFLPATADRDAKILADIAAHTYCQMVSDAPEVLGYQGIRPAKFDELVRVLTEDLADEKVIVYSRYEQVARWLADRLKQHVVTVFGSITGKVTEAAQTKARKLFNESHDPGILLITNAGSESIDLPAARGVTCYDLPWSHDELVQLIGRARRIGSRHANVLVYTFGHEATCDVKDQDRLGWKGELVQALNDRITVPAGPNMTAPAGSRASGGLTV